MQKEFGSATSCARPASIPTTSRRSRAGGEDLLGYLEVHIEQGPVLLKEGLPVGVVTSITGRCATR